MTFLGIDPGFLGAVAVICDGRATVHDMPVIKVATRTTYDVPRLSEIVTVADSEAVGGIFALVEHAQVFPGEGVKSCFSIGYGLGVIETVLSMLAIPYDLVRPKAWQAPFGVRGKGVDVKALAFAHARRMFPTVTFHTPRGRELDGRADALLIARYAEMTYGRERGNA